MNTLASIKMQNGFRTETHVRRDREKMQLSADKVRCSKSIVHFDGCISTRGGCRRWKHQASAHEKADKDALLTVSLAHVVVIGSG